MCHLSCCFREVEVSRTKTVGLKSPNVESGLVFVSKFCDCVRFDAVED